MPDAERPHVTGRGSQIDPPNRFGGPHHELDLGLIEEDPEGLSSLSQRPTEYFPDSSKTVVSRNESPDIPFNHSINPYRGCLHGCSYCYARPTHEYLGWNAGLDFETKILVKEQAPALLRDFLMNPKWIPEPIALSGVTDPYQPAERKYRITRGCLEVAREFGQPISLITKNALITRDLDLLAPMAASGLLHVNLSLTTLDEKLALDMEPRTSKPSIRLRAIEALSAAGIPVRVMLAPLIPGLNDTEIPAILEAARNAGARAAAFQMIRLPLTVAPVFQDWLHRTQPARADRVLAQIRHMRQQKLNSAEFGTRMRGVGERAQRIADLFALFTRRFSLDQALPPYDLQRFRPPGRQQQEFLF